MFLNLNFATLCLFVVEILFSFLLSQEDNNLPIIVIGSGISGISTARLLQNKGYNVLILEARYRYGGRIWTYYDAFNGAIGMEVDMGASWICNDDNGTIGIQLSQKYRLPTVYSNVLKPRAYFSNQTYMDENHFDKIFESYTKTLFRDLPDSLPTYTNYALSSSKASGRGGDLSLKSALNSSPRLRHILTNPVYALLNSHLVEADTGADFGSASARLFSNITAMNTRVVPGGYASLLKPLVDGRKNETALDIRFGHVVESIDSRSPSAVTVTTRSGQRIQGRAVIVTVPLGVLKNGAIRFEPTLPRKLQEAIRNLGFGNMNKIHIKFDSVFWPRELHTFGLVPSCPCVIANSPDASLYHSWLNGYYYTGQPVLIGFATGLSAYASEHLSDPKALEIAMTNLKKMFGSRQVINTKVVGMVRSKWAGDPYARGTWTFPTIGTTESDFQAFLNSPGPIFFAGEHTSPHHLGTVSGAYHSGVRVSHEVLEYMARKGDRRDNK